MYDKPITNKDDENDDSSTQLSASELRKLRNKQRKAQLKAEKENEKTQKKNQAKVDTDSKSEFAEVVDVAKVEKSETPLEDAMRFLTPYKHFGRHQLETHLLAFEVYFRKGKLLLQLQSLKRASRMCPPKSADYPTLLRQSCLFLNHLISNREQLPEVIRSVMRQELPTLAVFGMASASGDQASVDLFAQLPTTEAFLGKHLPPNSESFKVRVEHLKVKHFLVESAATAVNDASATPATKQLKPATESTESLLSSLVTDLAKLSDLTLEGALALYNAVKSSAFGQVTAPTVELLRQKLHTLYPYTSRFMSEKELTDLESELRDSDYFTAETDEFSANNANMVDE